MKTYDESELTKIVLQALETAIASEKDIVEGTLRPLRPIHKKYVQLWTEMKTRNLDIRLTSRDE